MSTRDFFKNSVLEAFGQVDPAKIGLSLLVALAMGILIYYVYKRFFTGVVYSRSFAVTLVAMCVLTCMVTLAISTNVVISLGMVGALSIVRYRTAVKDPLDLLYLFWAITTGITAGAGMYALVGLTAVVIARSTERGRASAARQRTLAQALPEVPVTWGSSAAPPSPNTSSASFSNRGRSHLRRTSRGIEPATGPDNLDTHALSLDASVRGAAKIAARVIGAAPPKAKANTGAIRWEKSWTKIWFMRFSPSWQRFRRDASPRTVR